MILLCNLKQFDNYHLNLNIKMINRGRFNVEIKKINYAFDCNYLS